MRRTRWFDGSKYVPAHVGVYERSMAVYSFETNTVVRYAAIRVYWDGLYWYMGDTPFIKSGKQDFLFRGLREDPRA